MGRTPCCDNNGLKKGPWTPEEDEKLLHYIQQFGYGNWRTLPKNAGLERCGKSCRLRWTNYLRPDIKRGRFSLEEEDTIIQLHSVLGNKWSTIAARLPGRTDNEIKNYWNTHIRKKLLRMGIDPVTHSPRLDLLDLSSILNPSFYNSGQSQINFSRFLGVQPRLNQELLKLATSLLSTQNVQQSQITSSQFQNPQFSQQTSHQYHSGIQENKDFVPFSNGADHQLIMEPNVEQYSTSFPNAGDQNFELSYWQGNDLASNAHDDYVPNVQNHDYYASENQNLQAENGSNQIFGYGMSNISTPSSSPYSTNVSTDDEKEINYSTVMKFEIPDFSDLSEFM